MVVILIQIYLKMYILFTCYDMSYLVDTRNQLFEKIKLHVLAKTMGFFINFKLLGFRIFFFNQDLYKDDSQL